MNRKRIRHIIRNLAILLVLGLLVFHLYGLYFSQEKLHRANERAMHYGPSDEILYRYTGKDGYGFIVSRCGDEGLSITSTRRILGFLWMNDWNNNGLSGFRSCETQVMAIDIREYDMVIGVVNGLDAAFVRIVYHLPSPLNLYSSSLLESPFVEAIPDENGFFVFQNVGVTLFTDPSFNSSPYFKTQPFAIAYDANGSVLAYSRSLDE